MFEEIEKRIQSVEGKGLERLIGIIKICLPLLPELLQQLDSHDPALQKSAAREARLIMTRLQEEFNKAVTTEGVSPHDLNGLLHDPKMFSPEEKVMIETLSRLVRRHSPHLKTSTIKKKFRPPPSKA